MRKIIIIFIALLYSCQSNKCLNKAQVIYEIELEIVQKWINQGPEDEPMSLGFVYNTVSFFERITEIPSEADGTSIGKLNITQQDYDNWCNWYVHNQRKLYWDSEACDVKVIAD